MRRERVRPVVAGWRVRFARPVSAVLLGELVVVLLGPAGSAAAGAAGVAGAAAVGSVAEAARVAGGATRALVAYRPPVAGALVVVRGYDDVGRYDPGHRGVDLRIPPPRTVLAAGAGVVTFAGQVAGRGVVTVQHADGVRTSYEPVAPAVAAGATVTAGAVLGTVSGAHGGFPAGTVLHWGARLGEDHLDPLSLLAPLGPVRLLPWADP